MHRVLSILTAFFSVASALVPHAVRTPAVELDSDGIGGYTGEYVVIYNNSLDPLYGMYTGNLKSMIQTEEAPGGHPARAEGLIDIDNTVKRHFVPAIPPSPFDPHDSIEVGSRRSFAVDPFYSPNGEHYMTFTCLAVGRHCYVWSLDSGSPNGHPLQDIDGGLADAFAAEFDSKYPLMRSSFGAGSER